MGDTIKFFCLSSHCKVNYCILRSGIMWIVCKDVFILPQVHVTPLYGEVCSVSFFSSNSFATSKYSQLPPSNLLCYCFTRVEWPQVFSSSNSTSEGVKLSAILVVYIKLWYITWWSHLFLSKSFCEKLIPKPTVSS